VPETGFDAASAAASFMPPNAGTVAGLVGGLGPLPSDFNTEEYGVIDEPGFVGVAAAPLSTFSIVVYAGAAGTVLPPTSGAEKATILDTLSPLEAGGSTAGGAGIRLAYELARKHFMEAGNNRVILATDGDFNVGLSSDGELVDLIERERESGVHLSVLGFGTGNLQDAKMERSPIGAGGNRRARTIPAGWSSGQDVHHRSYREQ